jgi:hypothetical protein
MANWRRPSKKSLSGALVNCWLLLIRSISISGAKNIRSSDPHPVMPPLFSFQPKKLSTRLNPTTLRCGNAELRLKKGRIA